MEMHIRKNLSILGKLMKHIRHHKSITTTLDIFDLKHTTYSWIAVIAHNCLDILDLL